VPEATSEGTCGGGLRPQRRQGCVCPSWTTRRGCSEARYVRGAAPDDLERHSEAFRDLLDDSCDCTCHDEGDDDE